MAHENIKKLAEMPSALAAINAGIIRCGFELEFQTINGASEEGDNRSNPEYDYDRLFNDSHDAYTQNADPVDAAPIELKTLIKMYLVSPNYLSTAAHEKAEEWLDSHRDEWCQEWESDVDMSDYLESKPDYHPREYVNKLPRICDIDTDQSVTGGEIRTRGACVPTDFVSAATELFAHNEFGIDEGCSFHIHLSVVGVQHAYGDMLQAEMIAFLLDNKMLLPDSVQERLNSQPGRKYAKCHISQEKFSAVHFHKELKTWEFRLFGNVTNADDARKCLLLAIDAIRWAYRVKLGMEKSLLRGLPKFEIDESFEKVAEGNETLREYVDFYASATSKEKYNAA